MPCVHAPAVTDGRINSPASARLGLVAGQGKAWTNRRRLPDGRTKATRSHSIGVMLKNTDTADTGHYTAAAAIKGSHRRKCLRQRCWQRPLWPFNPGLPGWPGALTKERLTGTTTTFLWAGCPSCHSTYKVKAQQENPVVWLSCVTDMVSAPHI